MSGARAAELFKEVAFCTPESLPPYDDEQVRLILEEVKIHGSVIADIFRDVGPRDRQRRLEAGEDPAEDSSTPWAEHYPMEASAIVIHHTAILRNKRLLLAYHSTRLNCIKALRWQHKALPDAIRQQLSPAEQQVFKGYDRILTKYMRRGTGVDLDLTLDEMPPRSPVVQVKVLKGHGDVMFSVGPTLLEKGTVHFLPWHEAEHLMREGVVKVLHQPHD